jgi:nicotinamide-nucleotide amidase
MRAIVITIGDEIISGLTVDTNAAYISQRLVSIGVDVTRRCSVGDNPDDIEREIRDGLAQFDVVITTGGLGPTDDDITKRSICRVFGCSLKEDTQTLEAITTRYRQLGVAMTEGNRGMAMQPGGAVLLSNPLGTAPGILFDRDGKIFCAMAGVPAEMRAIVDSGLVPYIEKKGSGRSIKYQSLCTFGIPESILAAKLKKGGYVPDGVRLAYLPSYAGVMLRLRAEGKDEAEASQLVDRNFNALYPLIREYVYSTEQESLLEHVTRLLREKPATVAVAESCTGGLIAKMLTDVPGSSAYFVQGVVAYANEAKTRLLGVKRETLDEHGAVSQEVCAEMGEGILDSSGADYAIATTGIAGPTGGTPEKPVGLVYIGVAEKTGMTVERRQFSGDRDIIRVRSANVALNMLRHRLTKAQP